VSGGSACWIPPPHTRDALSFVRMYILLGAVKLLAMVEQIVLDRPFVQGGVSGHEMVETDRSHLYYGS